MEKALFISWIRSKRNGFMTFLMKLSFENVPLQDLVRHNHPLVNAISRNERRRAKYQLGFPHGPELMSSSLSVTFLTSTGTSRKFKWHFARRFGVFAHSRTSARKHTGNSVRIDCKTPCTAGSFFRS